MKRVKSVDKNKTESNVLEDYNVCINYYDDSTSTRSFWKIEKLELCGGDNIFKNRVINDIILPTRDKMQELTGIEFKECIFMSSLNLSFLQMAFQVVSLYKCALRNVQLHSKWSRFTFFKFFTGSTAYASFRWPGRNCWLSHIEPKLVINPVMKLPTAEHFGLTEDKEKRLSEIIDEINSRRLQTTRIRITYLVLM